MSRGAGMSGVSRVAGVVVGHALVQTLLVLGDPVPGSGVGPTVRTVASFAAVLAALVATTSLVTGSRRWSSVTGAAAALLALAVVGTLVSAVVSGLVVVVGAAVLPAVARGASAPAHPLGRAWPAWPAWVAGVVVLVALCRVVALFAGFLLAPVAAAGVTWLVSGVAGVAALCSAPTGPGPARGPGAPTRSSSVHR